MIHKTMLRACATAMVCATPAWAADAGIGVAIYENSGAIFVPIDFGNRVRVEPYTAYLQTKGSSGNLSRRSSSNYSLGSGLFAVWPAADNTVLLTGARVGYVRQKEVVDNGGFGYSQQSSGYNLAPTVSFEYFFQKHLSIGAEVSFNHTRLKGSFSNLGLTTTDETTTTTRTSTAVTLRYFFR